MGNPATGDTLGTVPDMGAAETRRALEAAEKALPAWRRKSEKERGDVLRKWLDLILAHKEELACLMTAEQGKPLQEARTEVLHAASFIKQSAEEAERVYGNNISSPRDDSRITILKQPIGVCAAITRWNFPSAMITSKAGPALAAGCTMVLKPASATPFSALALAELGARAGIPKGVFSVLTGTDAKIEGELASNPIVKKLLFTDLTDIGKTLLAQSATTFKTISMEREGNAPFIVFSDADLDLAIDGVMVTNFRNSGQTSACANRILVHKDVYQVFTEKLIRRVRDLKVGPGISRDVDIGPLIDRAAVGKAKEHIADAVKKGARVSLGGGNHALGGLFFEPTVLIHVDLSMKVTYEVTSGPIAPLYSFETETEAIWLANDTPHGQAAYFYAKR